MPLRRITSFSSLEELMKKKGRWKLSPGHEVEYVSEGPSEELKFKGALVAAEPEALVLSVTERVGPKLVTRLVRLRGAWSADAQNRLVFEVEKTTGEGRALVFRSGWRIGERNELLYSFREERLKRKAKRTREIALEGHWDFSGKNRLVYRLAGDSGASISFRGAFQSKSVLAKKGEIRWQLGSGVSGGPRSKAVSLFGKWKVSRDLGLEFEMEYRGGRRSILFGADYALGPSRRVEANLKTREGQPLGVELVLTQEIFGGDGGVFVRLRRDLASSAAEAGARVLW